MSLQSLHVWCMYVCVFICFVPIYAMLDDSFFIPTISLGCMTALSCRWSSMSCLSVCLLVMTSLRTAILHFTLYDHDPAEIADLIEMPFGCGLVGSQVTMYQMGGSRSRTGRANFGSGVSGPFKHIGNDYCAVRSKRDHVHASMFVASLLIFIQFIQQQVKDSWPTTAQSVQPFHIQSLLQRLSLAVWEAQTALLHRTYL